MGFSSGSVFWLVSKFLSSGSNQDGVFLRFQEVVIVGTLSPRFLCFSFYWRLDPVAGFGDSHLQFTVIERLHWNRRCLSQSCWFEGIFFRPYWRLVQFRFQESLQFIESIKDSPFEVIWVCAFFLIEIEFCRSWKFPLSIQLKTAYFPIGCSCVWFVGNGNCKSWGSSLCARSSLWCIRP